jgi:hypothetical protein
VPPPLIAAAPSGQRFVREAEFRLHVISPRLPIDRDLALTARNFDR